MSFRSAKCHSDQAQRVEESVLYLEENGFFDSRSLAQNDTNFMALPGTPTGGNRRTQNRPLSQKAPTGWQEPCFIFERNDLLDKLELA